MKLSSITLAMVAILCPAFAMAQSISESAEAYLDEALRIVQDNGLHADQVDWTEVKAKSLALVGTASEPADMYAAVDFVLKALNKHSFLQLSEKQMGRQTARREALGLPPYVRHMATEDEREYSNYEKAFMFRRHPSLTLLPIGDKFAAAIVMPSAPGGAPGTQTLVERTRIALDSAAEVSCGYIVDLRGNGGGNTWPMVLGLQPLLGETDIGGSISSDGSRVRFIVRASESGIIDTDKRFQSEWSTDMKPGPDLSAEPVAVLINQNTGSSGEAAAIAFIGRNNTKSFGRFTAGYTTSNKGFKLSDGVNMVVTVGEFFDRTDRRYPNGVEPEHVTDPILEDTPWRDATLRAAMTWLSERSECQKQ